MLKRSFYNSRCSASAVSACSQRLGPHIAEQRSTCAVLNASTRHRRFCEAIFGRFRPVNRCQQKGRISVPAATDARQVDATSATQEIPNLHLECPWRGMDEPTVNLAVKFGGSSVASADRMAEVAHIVCGFEKTMPVVVLSAMGKTTNLLLQAGSEALHTSPRSVGALQPLRCVRKLVWPCIQTCLILSSCLITPCGVVCCSTRPMSMMWIST